MATSGRPTVGPGQNGGNGHKSAGLKLRMPERLSAGVYANSLVVHHGPSEFVMDWALVAGGAGAIVARVITSPGHMKRVIQALEENVHKYETQFGPIELVPAPGDQGRGESDAGGR
jgi:hypothetical protein